MQLDVDRSDLHRTRVVATEAPAELPDGYVHLELESFALTANNITYAVAGDMLDYWGFFPTEAPWGRIPVMGIGRVVRSTVPGVETGERFFGFYPMADQHVVEASASAGGFIDRAEHRAPHASTYRTFSRVVDDRAYDPDLEGQYLIARGLFITSYLVDDFLGEHDLFGATTVVVTSASSRTSIALAHRLRARGGVHVVGLTSERSRAFVNDVGLYDEVLGYDDLEQMSTRAPAVVVDMAGNVDVLGRIHHHLGEQLQFSSRVGATHHDAGGSVSALPGPTPTFFFAPTQVKNRSKEWGREVFEERVADALRDFLQHAAGWMQIERSSGPEALQAVYLATLDGQSDPRVGHILTLVDHDTSSTGA